MVTEHPEGQAFARECPAQGHDISQELSEGYALQAKDRLNFLCYHLNKEEKLKTWHSFTNLKLDLGLKDFFYWIQWIYIRGREIHANFIIN